MGPKLRNRGFKGLRNFAEQLQCATKILQGGYEREASTTAKMKLIAEQLPDSLINKWADVSYSIREKGQNPGLEDLAKFVKRQAAIKNDPGFAGVVATPTLETRANKKNHPTELKCLRLFVNDSSAKVSYDTSEDLIVRWEVYHHLGIARQWLKWNHDQFRCCL